LNNRPSFKQVKLQLERIKDNERTIKELTHFKINSEHNIHVNLKNSNSESNLRQLNLTKQQSRSRDASTDRSTINTINTANSNTISTDSIHALNHNLPKSNNEHKILISQIKE
jgi:hypothetical protein